MSGLLLQALRRQAQVSLPQLLQPALSFVPLAQQGPVGSAWHSPTTSSSSCTCGSNRSYASLNIQQVEQLRKELSRPARSLQFDERPPAIPSELSQSMLGKLLLNVLMFNDSKNQMIVGGQALYDAIREQVDDGVMCTAFGMDPKIFYSSYTLLAIHVWLVIHRLSHRNDKDVRFFKQRFHNHFQADVERRIYDAGVQIGVSKWLKKLESVFYSCGLSFDRVLRGEDSAVDDSQPDKPGLKGSRSDMASRLELVVLREFFGGDATKTLQAELITRYLLLQMDCLEMTSDEAITQGRIQFTREPFMNLRANMLKATAPAAGAQLPQTN